MQRRTRSGLTVTFSDFWLDKLTCQDQRYSRISTIRRNDKSIPLSHREAKEYFFRERDFVEFTDDATDYIEHLLGWASRY